MEDIEGKEVDCDRSLVYLLSEIFIILFIVLFLFFSLFDFFYPSFFATIP